MSISRTVCWTVVWAVAVMSGILSIVREAMGLLAPNHVPATDLFWTCARLACGGALIALWWRERSALKIEKEKRVVAEENARPHIILLYSKLEPPEPTFEDGVITSHRRESELLVSNTSLDKHALEINLNEFTLGTFTIIGRPNTAITSRGFYAN
jgi:hypothetical protein